jgi:preprotein translocase subunit SecY
MESLKNIFAVADLRKRVLFTLGLLAVYRVGGHIPTPGINPEALRALVEQASNTMFGLYDMFSGNNLSQMTIFALGIMPYISSSIILQLLTIVVPRLEELKKEGEEGRRVITRYTRYGTVVLSLLQSLMLAFGLEQGALGNNAVFDPGWSFRIMTVITLTAGTAFIMWLGEQITERGIGNGISLVIFAGIVTAIPSALTAIYELVRTEQIPVLGLPLLAIFMVGVVAVIVYFERAQRRIPIQYARRVVGRQQVGGQTTYFPLRLNSAGVIPPIFASALLSLPYQVSQYGVLPPVLRDFFDDYLNYASLPYNLAYVGLIVFFAYFYTGIMINPDDVAENIKKGGGYIPGIRPGKNTAQYITDRLNRITLIGSLYLAGVCVLPQIMTSQFGIPFFFGGTALLICVGVAMDTVGQVEAHLVSRNYDTLMQGVRIRGRSGR